MEDNRAVAEAHPVAPEAESRVEEVEVVVVGELTHHYPMAIVPLHHLLLPLRTTCHYYYWNFRSILLKRRRRMEVVPVEEGVVYPPIVTDGRKRRILPVHPPDS